MGFVTELYMSYNRFFFCQSIESKYMSKYECVICVVQCLGNDAG